MKVEVCFKCRVYCYVDEHYIGKQALKEFEEEHANHPRQIVDEHELSFEYHNVSQKLVEKLDGRTSVAKTS